MYYISKKGKKTSFFCSPSKNFCKDFLRENNRFLDNIDSTIEQADNTTKLLTLKLRSKDVRTKHNEYTSKAV